MTLSPTLRRESVAEMEAMAPPAAWSAMERTSQEMKIWV